MSAWSEFYTTRAHTYSRYADYARKRYAPFLVKILSQIQWNSRIAEIGCGMGTITSILHECSSLVRVADYWISTDIDTDMLDIAKLHLNRRDVRLFQHDAREAFGLDRNPVDIVHSHGLLEHFEDGSIRQIINAHKGSYQVHYVPGLYETPSFGDERLMSVDDWRAICAPDEIHTFNDGLDYALIFHPH